MRESGYDPYVRQFEISDQGIQVLGPFDTMMGFGGADTNGAAGEGGPAP
jgi:hypothetical protein